MISYLDRTFCKFHEDCQHGTACSRSLTEKIRDDAEAFGLPLSLYMDKPQCHLEVIPDKVREW